MTSDSLTALIHRDFPAAQRGDRNAFTRLVAATQRLVASVALAVTRDVPASEDIAQEIFLTAWQRLDRMKNPDSFLPWLRQVTRHRAIDHLRTRARRETTMPQADQLEAIAADARGGPAEVLGEREEERLLAESLDEIPPESREVLLLYYREGQSSRGVADLLGLSDAAVRKRLQRARDLLRQELLARIGAEALASAPGVAFTATVGAALSATPKAASAAAAGASIVAKASGNALLGMIGALVASLGLMMGAVFWEVRLFLSKARGPIERRALLRNGIVYASVMASYTVVLWWSSRAGWSLAQTLGVAALFSVAIIALGVARQRIITRARRNPE